MSDLALQALERIQLKAEYFVDIQVWPLPEIFNPLGWLDNFSKPDRPLAALLLDSFLYFSERLTDALFVASIHELSSEFIAPTRKQSTVAWQAFLHNALFCIVTGETPRPTDSGYLFARKVRQVLNVSEINVLEPLACLETLATDGPQPVIFVDDFVGSGDQFCRMWARTYPTSFGEISFTEYTRAQRTAGLNSRFYYCPILSTQKGEQVLLRDCPEVSFHPAHVLDPQMSPLDPQTRVFPDALRNKGQEMIERQSLAIGLVANAWKGYRNLATSVAFSHGIPDATLPIFYHETATWTPLMRRK